MAYDSRVFRVLIASPSDVEEEREIAVRVIQEWNDLYSYSRNTVLLPLRWETHTAPEFGTRPQEVINRAIVDECDLLVGVFWTRIGTPTGEAESGTLEEIERVGKSGKPVMLYFSRVAIDPERIDHSQNEKLREFKDNSYPKGLIESYKSIIEFRDKFSKQLELKVRDLQRLEGGGEPPLTLEFLSADEARPIGNCIKQTMKIPVVRDFTGVPRGKLASVKEIVAESLKGLAYFPLAMVLHNASSAGIRNVYMEIDIKANAEGIEVTETPTEHSYFSSYSVTTLFRREFSAHSRRLRSQSLEKMQKNLARFDADELQETNDGWHLSVEWEALQPQRTRLVKPVLYVYAPVSTKIHVQNRVYGDSFAEPLVLTASADLAVKRQEVAINELLPNWKELIQEKESDG